MLLDKNKEGGMVDVNKDDMVNKKDLEAAKKELLDKLTSKNEFQQEVAKLATKEELKQEVAKLSTRESLEIVATEVVKHSAEIAEIKIELKHINLRIEQMRGHFDNKFDIVLNAIDGVAKELSDMRTEKAAVDHSLTRHEERLDDHEVRIERLEMKRA